MAEIEFDEEGITRVVTHIDALVTTLPAAARKRRDRGEVIAEDVRVGDGLADHDVG